MTTLYCLGGLRHVPVHESITGGTQRITDRWLRVVYVEDLFEPES